MDKIIPKYFLGANSCEGFVSHFGDCYRADDGWHALIIKGGAGTGKSSLMKYIAARAMARGIAVEFCICSSDPDSLDGIIMPKLKTVMLDGTAPHIVEPVYPAVCEEIINLGEFWDRDKILPYSKKILDTSARNKAFHRAAAKYLAAVKQLMSDNLRIAGLATDKEKLLSFAERTATRLIPKRKSVKGTEWVRFIGGITPKGIVTFANTLKQNNMFIISDKYGAASDIIVRSVRERALNMGYEIITIKNPFLPSELTDHVIIPELSLAVVTENEFTRIDSPERRIHARRFIDSSVMSASRSRLLFNRRMSRELLEGACRTLARAKAVHDELEAFYIRAMDFDGISKYAIELEKKIFINE